GRGLIGPWPRRHRAWRLALLPARRSIAAAPQGGSDGTDVVVWHRRAPAVDRCRRGRGCGGARAPAAAWSPGTNDRGARRGGVAGTAPAVVPAERRRNDRAGPLPRALGTCHVLLHRSPRRPRSARSRPLE